MKKLLGLGALAIAMACVGCGSSDDTVSTTTGGTPAPAGGGKVGSKAAPGAMGAPQLTSAGQSVQPGSRTR